MSPNVAKERRAADANAQRAVHGAKNVGATAALLTRAVKSLARVLACNTKGKRVVTGSSDGAVRIWDIETGAEITYLRMPYHPNWVQASFNYRDLDAKIQPVVFVSFTADGKYVVAGSSDGSAAIFDVSRSDTIMRRLDLTLAASLACGIGRRTESESADVLMSELPNGDIFAQFLSELGRTVGDADLQELTARLHAPLHDNCYLSPTQLSEKFETDRDRSLLQSSTPNTGPSETPIWRRWTTFLGRLIKSGD